MSVQVKEVINRRDLRRFILFPESLYKDNPYYTPPLFFGEFATLWRKANPASEFCDYALYLAYKDGRIAGRIAAIVNRLANSKWNHREVRFGWFDFIDDREVSAALISKASEFGRQRGMDSIVGPLGFTDFDPEGMLVEGFDRPSTMALRYNYPYYREHIEALGFAKDVDWLECRIFCRGNVPERMLRFSKIAAERSRVHVRKIDRRTLIKGKYSLKIFKLINLCYKDLYDFTILPDHMSEKYIGFYIHFVNPKYISLVENDKGELVAFGISMPSLARALQKCRGRILPFGWWHILRAMHGKGNDGIEMLLIGVHPDYRNTAINSLMFEDLYRKYVDDGFEWAETNATLETNFLCMRQWDEFSKECAKRRRAYKKPLK
ncbi:MAG: N-acetyltransferase [Bacteroidales bacterium]|nr:N-acetyltransferase [Bacteroidales bacterium]